MLIKVWILFIMVTVVPQVSAPKTEKSRLHDGVENPDFSAGNEE